MRVFRTSDRNDVLVEFSDLDGVCEDGGADRSEC